jgi:hypothetical protein
MSLKSLVIASFVVAFGTTAAIAAEDFPIPQTVTVPAYDFQGRSIDIIGFKPGMKAEEALAVLKQRKPEVYIGTSKIGNGSVRSQEFPSRYSSWERENEEINVLMTSPSAGNEVFSVSRRLEFWTEEKRPDFEATLKAFTDKYGAPSAVNDELPDPKYLNKKGRYTTLMWYLGGDGKCDLTKFDSMVGKVSEVCTETSHETGPSVKNVTYTPAKAEIYQKTATAGSDVVLVAKVYNSDGSQRAFSITVSFVDLKRRALAAAEDIKLIEAEQAKFDSVKVAAPEL